MTKPPEHPAWLGPEPISVMADRAEIESLDVENVLRIFQRFYQKEASRQFCERVRFVLRGYEEDKRAPFEIPEVRSWIAMLDRGFPYWFFFLEKRLSDSLHWITLCLCQSTKVTEDGVKVDRKEIEKFIAQHLGHLKEICRTAGYSHTE